MLTDRSWPSAAILNAHLPIHGCVTHQLDSSIAVDAKTVLDLIKAFDRLSHSNILSTLSRRHISSQFMLWLKDFLSNRS